MDSNNMNTNYNQQMPVSQQQGVELEEPVKLGEWIVSLLLMMIPCVNIILMFVWAFSKTEKKSKSNLFKAYLIMFAIMFAVSMVFSVLFGAGIAALISAGM